MISATHLHAIIIHFPVALLMVGFLLEIIVVFIKNDSFFKILHKEVSNNLISKHIK
ncbi:MAG: hypothetical protein PHW92_07085 [Lutibacter sp.]|nr:hypothetical protein [Lutibacter sp.]